MNKTSVVVGVVVDVRETQSYMETTQERNEIICCSHMLSDGAGQMYIRVILLWQI